MKINIKKLEVKADDRGWLAEIMRPEDVHDQPFGQIFVTTANPGKVKGKHYHKRKTEWYCVISGKGLLSLRDNNTNEEMELELDGSEMKLVEIPPNNFHSIKNIGNIQMFLLVYISEAFDPEDHDTYYE